MQNESNSNNGTSKNLPSVATLSHKDSSTTKNIIKKIRKSNSFRVLDLNSITRTIKGFYIEFIDEFFEETGKENFNHKNIDIKEILFIYFANNYGLETLAKSKYLDFLIQLKNISDNKNKRIFVFKQLLQLEEDRSSPYGTGNITNSSEKQIGVFEIRQIIQLIYKLKISNCILFNSTDENLMLLNANKVHEILIELLNPYHISNEIKILINDFFKFKIEDYSKNMINLKVLDFDEFLEFSLQLYLEIKLLYDKDIINIFTTLDVLLIY